MAALGSVLCVCLLLGHLFDRALLGDPGCGALERGGRGLALGLGLAGGLSMACDTFGLGVTRVTVGAAVALVLLLSLVACVQRTTPRAHGDGRGRLAGLSARELALVLGLLLLAAVGVGVAVRSGWIRPTLQFDAIVRWMWKAKALAVHETLLGPLSSDPAFGFTHQRYPPLISHVANLVQLVHGSYDDRLQSAIFPWFAVATVAMAYGAVARRSGALTGALAAFWIAHLPLLSYAMAPPPGAGAASAMADIPLSMFVLGAVLAVADALDGKRDRAHLELGLFLGFAALTKNEGLPFVALTVALVALLGGRGSVRRALGVGLVGAGLFALLWGWVAAGLPATDENYPAQLGLATITVGFGRLGTILPRLGMSMLDIQAWNVTWLAVLTLLAGSVGLLRRPGLRLIVLLLALQLGTYILAFMVTAWSSPAAELIAETTGVGDVVGTLMNLTADRLLMHLAPAAICAALIAAPVRLTRAG